MKMRKWILWSFFGLLGLNIALSCYGLLNGSEDTFFRGLINSLTLAVACLLVYPASWLGLVKHARHASWALMGLLAFEVLLLVILTLVIGIRVGVLSGNLDEFVAIMISFTLPTGLLIVLALYLKVFNALRQSSQILIAGCILFVILMTCYDFFEQIARHSRMRNIFEGLSILVGWLGVWLVLLMAGRWRWYKAIAFMAALNSTIMFFFQIFDYNFLQGRTSGLFIATTSLAIVLAFGNLLWLLPLKAPWTKLSRLGAMGLALATVCLLLVWGSGAWQFTNSSQQAIARFAGALAFIAICLTFVISFKAAVDAIKIRRADIPAQFNYTQLHIHCPHCQTAQLLTEAGQYCCECGLQFHFRITEPHCSQCDYLIIGQNNGHCPECGHAISQASGTRVMPA